MPIEGKQRTRESIEEQLRELRAQMAGADVILARAIISTIKDLEEELHELDSKPTTLEAYQHRHGIEPKRHFVTPASPQHQHGSRRTHPQRSIPFSWQTVLLCSLVLILIVTVITLAV